MKVAVIIAGGSGIGAAAARALHAQGHHVAILSSSGRGAALAAELGGLGVTGTNQSVADLARVIDGAADRWGRVDVLVNSGGHGPRGGVLTLTDDDWLKGAEVYLTPVIRAVRRVVPHMAAGGGGAIVNVGSYVSVEPDTAYPMSSVYRAGLMAFQKMVADEVAPAGIRINTVACGFYDTLPGNPVYDRVTVPMGRYGRAEEVAKTIAFLASDAAGYITGQTIRADGGLTRST
jgi:NAD(P)-dependent dehydrogenase (short-subunit alcohol dehydrogenase family)